MKILMEDEDYRQIRTTLANLLDFIPTDDQIDRALNARIELRMEALQYQWSDPRVREQLAHALKLDQELERL